MSIQCSIVLLISFCIIYSSVTLVNVVFPAIGVLKSLVPAFLTGDDYDPIQEDMDRFFSDITKNIAHLKHITERYDNSSQANEIMQGFSKMDEYLLKMEHRNYKLHDTYDSLRKLVNHIAKHHRRLFFKEKQSLNVLRHFVPRLLDVIRESRKECGDYVENDRSLITGVDMDYVSSIIQFLEIMSSDFHTIQRDIVEIEKNLYALESVIRHSQLITMTESRETHLALSTMRESTINWMFQFITNHQRNIRSLHVDLVEIREIEKYTTFLTGFLNNKQHMLHDISIFNEAVLSKTSSMSSALVLTVTPPSNAIMAQFEYELNTLNILLNTQHHITSLLDIKP